MLPLNLVLLGFAHLAMLGEHLLLFLLFRSSQRAEYYADTLAAEVAGASAVMSGLEKTYYAHLYPLGVQRVALRKEGTLFDELRALAGAMPEREIERIRRASRITGSQVDTTHPPTPFRYDLIRQRGHEGKQDLLDESLAAAIDHELEEEYARAHRAAIDEYRSSLYR